MNMTECRRRPGEFALDGRPICSHGEPMERKGVRPSGSVRYQCAVKRREYQKAKYPASSRRASALAATVARRYARELSCARVAYELSRRREEKVSKRQQKRDLVDYVKSRGCSRCGYTGPSCHFDFHHRDPAQKVFSVGSAASDSTYGVGRFWSEVAKCDVLCKFCHCDHHWGGGPAFVAVDGLFELAVAA